MSAEDSLMDEKLLIKQSDRAASLNEIMHMNHDLISDQQISFGEIQMVGMNFKKVDAGVDAQNDLQLSIDTNTLYQPFRRTIENIATENELTEKPLPMHTPQTPRISNINVQKNKK